VKLLSLSPRKEDDDRRTTYQERGSEPVSTLSTLAFGHW
jgi:hypothetical protein